MSIVITLGDIVQLVGALSSTGKGAGSIQTQVAGLIPDQDAFRRQLVSLSD